MSSNAGRAEHEAATQLNVTDGNQFSHDHAAIGDALVAMDLSERLPIGVAHDRRSAARISTGVAPAPAGQLFLEELSHDERLERIAQSTNPLDQASRAYRIIEVLAVANEVVEQNDLGEVWLSLRDSDMAGLLPMARHIHVRVKLDRLDPDGPLTVAGDLVKFIEDRASVADADGVIISTIDERLVETLGARGYLIVGPRDVGRVPATDKRAVHFENALDDFATKRGFVESEVGLLGTKPSSRVWFRANRSLR